MAIRLHSMVKVAATMPRRHAFGKGKAIVDFAATPRRLALARALELR
jgi:hypothetical protein